MRDYKLAFKTNYAERKSKESEKTIGASAGFNRVSELAVHLSSGFLFAVTKVGGSNIIKLFISEQFRWNYQVA